MSKEKNVPLTDEIVQKKKRKQSTCNELKNIIKRKKKRMVSIAKLFMHS
jgi:hypothetical protein